MEAIKLNSWEVRLGSAFIYNPSEYNFVGTCKGDFCACGHIIKTAYVIRHSSGHELNLGCDCIESFSQLSGIHDQIKEHTKKQKAAVKAQIEANQSAEFQELLKDEAALLMVVRDLRNKGVFMDRSVWMASRQNSGAYKLKSIKGKIKKQIAYNKTLKDAMLAAGYIS